MIFLVAGQAAILRFETRLLLTHGSDEVERQNGWCRTIDGHRNDFGPCLQYLATTGIEPGNPLINKPLQGTHVRCSLWLKIKHT